MNKTKVGFVYMGIALIGGGIALSTSLTSCSEPSANDIYKIAVGQEMTDSTIKFNLDYDFNRLSGKPGTLSFWTSDVDEETDWEMFTISWKPSEKLNVSYKCVHTASPEHSDDFLFVTNSVFTDLAKANKGVWTFPCSLGNEVVRVAKTGQEIYNFAELLYLDEVK